MTQSTIKLLSIFRSRLIYLALPYNVGATIKKVTLYDITARALHEPVDILNIVDYL